MFRILAFLFYSAAACLLLKLLSVYGAADEIRTQIAERMETDTNVGIDITCSDKRMRNLAADLDRQLKLLRQKEIRYTRGDQELKTAITNMSHDIRTPLTAIYGYLNLLEGEEMSEEAAQYLAYIQNRVDALKALSEELFHYSVVLSVDSYDETEELSLHALLEESIAAYMARL